MPSCKITAIANQKGGVGKTSTTWNLGYALAKEGHRVLLCDFDSQSNLSMVFGIEQPEKLPLTMHNILGMILQGEPLPESSEYIQKGNKPGLTLDIIPSNINLAATEINLRDEMGGEHTLSELLNPLREKYSRILIDTSPFLGLLTINALAACDDVIIPVSPQLWSATGLTDLLQTITKIKRKINPKISISGILLTICDERTRLFKEAKALLNENYGEQIKIFDTHIPNTIKVGEANYNSLSVVEHDPNSKAAIAYANLAKEVIGNE
jgi:chromosome partitioning protein